MPGRSLVTGVGFLVFFSWLAGWAGSNHGASIIKVEPLD